MKMTRNLLLSALVFLAGSAVFEASAAPGDARPPAETLKPATTAEVSPAADGFIQRWVILEPIPVSAQITESASRATISSNYFPDQLTIMPHDGDKVTVAGKEMTWHALDTIHYNFNLYHYAYALNRPTSDVLFWAVTIVNCPEEEKDVRLAIGSNASSIWWVNGQEVTSVYGDRQTVIDDGVSKRLTLHKGQNILRCAVINSGGATDFCARFLDSHDQPLKNYKLSLPK